MFKGDAGPGWRSASGAKRNPFKRLTRRSCPEPRNRGHADVVRSGEVFQRRALRAALAGFRLLRASLQFKRTLIPLRRCIGIEGLSQRSGIGDEQITPHAMLSKPGDGVGPPLRGLGFDIGGIGDLPFNFGDHVETGIRLQK